MISANTLSFHYGKHHKAYVDNLNNLVKGTEYESAPLEKIIRDTAGKADKAGLFNNAAQVWNHTFYWNCLKGGGGGKPTGQHRADDRLRSRRLRQVQEGLRATPRHAIRLGLGLARRRGRQAQDREDAQRRACRSPRAQTPLLTIDVWEHAYYLDYQNRRPDHVNAVIDKLLNWDFAAENLARA